MSTNPGSELYEKFTKGYYPVRPVPVDPSTNVTDVIIGVGLNTILGLVRTFSINNWAEIMPGWRRDVAPPLQG